MPRHRWILGLLVALTVVGCKTPEGPRIPLPPQDVTTSAPAGLVRVVFYNTSIDALNWATGTVRIQVDGRTAPSLYLNHYAQVFLEPGPHELLLAHWDMFEFTDRYTITLAGREAFFEVYTTPFGTKYRQVDALPPDFMRRFKGGRDPSQWPQLEPAAAH